MMNSITMAINKDNKVKGDGSLIRHPLLRGQHETWPGSNKMEGRRGEGAAQTGLSM